MQLTLPLATLFLTLAPVPTLPAGDQVKEYEVHRQYKDYEIHCMRPDD
jgi:hypothetical protein